MESGSENAAVIEAVKDLAEAEVISIADNAVVVVPRGKEIHDLRPYIDARRTAPERRSGTASFTAIESFIRHALRFADDSSAIFAVDDPSAPKLVSVLNYHQLGHDGAPRFGDHRGVYAFPLSDEWRVWGSLPEKMSQADFAAFLEDHAVDVLAPAAVGEKTAAYAEEHGITLASQQRLTELSRGLSVRVDAKVAQHINPSTGEAQLVYEESHLDRNGGALKVPDGFVIAIPVFRGGPLYQIVCRLRYRVVRNEGKVVWGIALHRADKVFTEAFGEAAQRAATETGLPLFYGTPEASGPAPAKPAPSRF